MTVHSTRLSKIPPSREQEKNFSLLKSKSGLLSCILHILNQRLHRSFVVSQKGIQTQYRKIEDAIKKTCQPLSTQFVTDRVLRKISGSYKFQTSSYWWRENKLKQVRKNSEYNLHLCAGWQLCSPTVHIIHLDVWNTLWRGLNLKVALSKKWMK